MILLIQITCRGALAEGHVCIVPAEHVASGRRTDEATWTELRNFKKSLLQMFMQQVGLDKKSQTSAQPQCLLHVDAAVMILNSMSRFADSIWVWLWS